MKSRSTRWLSVALATALAMTGTIALIHAPTHAATTAPIVDEAKLGKSDILMKGGRTTDGDNGLGNLVADTMRDAMHADFALVNADAVQGEINWGWISKQKVASTLPYNYRLLKYEIKGRDLYTILNAQLKIMGGADYSVSGLKYVWSAEKGTVTQLTLADGHKLAEDATYTVVVNEAIAASSPLVELGRKIEVGPTDNEAFIAWLTKQPGLIAHEPEGRIRQELQQARPEEITIRDARAAERGTLVTVKGIVSSTPGIWGGQRFYIQDGSDAVYVYNMEDKVRLGDIVVVTGYTDMNVGEFRLNGLVALDVVSHLRAPIPREILPSQLNDSTQSQLVRISGGTITAIFPGVEFGNFGFLVKKNGEEAFIRSDTRSGLTYEKFVQHFKVGDVVDCTGISNRWVDYLQMNVRSPQDVVHSK